MNISWSRNAGRTEVARARSLAATYGLTLVQRDGPLDDTEPVLVVAKGGLAVNHGGRIYRWHQGMLHTRRESGANFPLVKLGGIRPGHTVLDVTMGQGVDARFLAEWTGRGSVGVEISLPVALMAREGLAAAGVHVRVLHADGLQVLRETTDKAFDHVLVDPMFPTRPEDDRLSPALDGLRLLSHHGSVDPAWIGQAARVARKSVLVRDVLNGGLLQALDCPHVWRRANRKATYGVWRGAALEAAAGSGPLAGATVAASHPAR